MTSGYIFQNCECFVPDEWVHVAGVFDADKQTISLYQNGILAGSTRRRTRPSFPAATRSISGAGGFDDTRRLTGDLDDFVVYNRALTLPEIQQLARAPLPATPPP